MKLTYLGTGAAEGFPAMFCKCEACKKAMLTKGKNIRSRSQSLINDDLLIDFPPDSYMHFLQNSLNFEKIKNIIITHTHEDHLYLHDITLRRPGFIDYDKDDIVSVYGNESFIKLCESYKNESFFDQMLKSTKFVLLKEFTEVNIGKYKITPLLADHNPKEKCFNYIVFDGEKRLLYAHDTGYFREETWNFIKNIKFDLVSLDCNDMAGNNAKNHMGLNCCLEVKTRLINEKQADKNTKFILNHFTHNGKMMHEDFLLLASKYGFLVSFDGMGIDF